MRLLRLPEPFNHPDFVFELKLDGFRALAIVRGSRGELVSRDGYQSSSRPSSPMKSPTPLHTHNAP
jgi:ATP-dependent DNA ligase